MTFHKRGTYDFWKPATQEQADEKTEGLPPPPGLHATKHRRVDQTMIGLKPIPVPFNARTLDYYGPESPTHSTDEMPSPHPPRKKSPIDIPPSHEDCPPTTNSKVNWESNWGFQVVGDSHGSAYKVCPDGKAPREIGTCQFELNTAANLVDDYAY
jgi:hypothetical protein